MDQDTTKLAQACDVLGDRALWFRPDRYNDGLALCIIDSIQSTGSHYNSVVNVVKRYRASRNGAASSDGTPELLTSFEDYGGVSGWAKRIGNQKPASTRAGASLKAAVIQEVAQKLHDAGVRTAADLRQHGAREPGNDERRRVTKKLWTSVEAQSSGITWEYALMLAGLPGAKADRMVVRFVSDAVGVSDLSPERAAGLVRDAAGLLSVNATDLDHAIWRYGSGRPVMRQPDAKDDIVLDDDE
ncbi:heme peroxidase [Rhodococcus sp. WMMA185]|uniref:heme peroxidase n=1 Tax=Rhodococcus sp. WMMA185 TaxID=679318 RepID=UPI001E404290|nr:heme peroxidase [Rhodococcus sp. WMMA185]